ncbi:MAG TPA: integrase core domain-containing protein [Candidatus Eisenbacteria bacterium]
MAFALDCCDREAIAVVAEARPIDGADNRRLIRQPEFSRFGNEKPTEPVRCLGDNEGIYASLETVIAAEKLSLTPITTPVASPESNVMSEALENTLRRDHPDGADWSSAAGVLERIPGWITDYNQHAPHSALGYRSPLEYRREQTSETVSGCLTK